MTRKHPDELGEMEASETSLAGVSLAQETNQSKSPTGADADKNSRQGKRRTKAKPLAADWEPQVQALPNRKAGLKKLAATYGWRVYAIPALLVLSVLVLADTTAPTITPQGANAAEQQQEGAGKSQDVPTSPPREIPPVKINPAEVPTAVLPEGPSFTEKGTNAWQKIPGSTDKVGSGTLYRYAIAIEEGIAPNDYGGDRDTFARTIDGFLADNRSWIGTGEVAMQRVDGNGPVNFTISLTSAETAHEFCGFEIPFETSCWRPELGRVVINVARWVRGAKVFGNDLASYRQYVVNHEVGHALGHGHEGCKENGAPAPVMMQQTFGVANNYVASLNNTPNGQPGSVVADGKVCTANAFPVAPR